MNAKKTWQGGRSMDKEEILKKSRAKNKDEGAEHAIAEGAKWGFFGMGILYIFLVAMTIGLEGPNSETLIPLHGLFWSGLGFSELGRASVNHEKRLRISGIAKTVIGIVYILLYFVILCIRLEKRG
jgi:hypothetical protein